MGRDVLPLPFITVAKARNSCRAGGWPTATPSGQGDRRDQTMRCVSGRSAPALAAAIAGIMLSVSACSGPGGGAAICASAGGTVVDGTCSRWSVRLEAAKQMCETSGGVFLAGQDTCAYGMGGP